jgi:Chaperone of endosialidase
MKTITLTLSSAINHSVLRWTLILIQLVLMCVVVVPRAGAVTPPPDGGYPGFNTAEGDSALQSLTSGAANTAVGLGALFHDTTGSNNTALGFEALFSNTTGFENTATGWRALFANTTGFHNNAYGFFALLRNTTGNHNTANGDEALRNNTRGNDNTVDGAHSLENNTIGSGNTVLGFGAGNNVTTASNVICIGSGVVGANVSNSAYIGSVFGQMSSGGAAVFINASGKLGTSMSSRRFKEEIKPMERTSEALFALKPVTFRYKKEIDPAGTPQFGLVAEEVEKVDPTLVVRDQGGKPYTVRYEAVNAMLLNEFLKEHRTVRELEQEVAVLAATVKEQATQIQKISAQIDTNKLGPQIVLNNEHEPTR